ncbi:MAG: acyl-CoA synthetase [Pseudomonadales bacterium]
MDTSAVETSGRIISGDRVLPLAEMHQRALRAARGLQSLGVGAGDTFAVLLRNDFAFFEAAYAANRLGAHLVPINWHFSGPEVAYILEDSGARALIAHTDLLAGMRELMPAAVQLLLVETPPEIRRVYGVEEQHAAAPAGDSLWSEWLEGFDPLAPAEVPAPGSMIYTSGTTGRPKGVKRQPPNDREAEVSTEVMARIFGFHSEAPVALLTAPMYHATPNGFFRMAVASNATIVIESRFDPERYLALIDQHRVTDAYGVATMFVRLLRLPEDVRRSYDVSSLRCVVHGAAPTAPEIKRAMIAWWGPVLVEHYGSTELGAVVACDSTEWLAHPGTVGRALPHVQLRILDADGNELPPGEIGEIYARPIYPDFTYQNDSGKRAAMERDGFWTAGDIGYLDAAGYLYLSDRKNDMVISGGVNIYPKEIESELLALNKVRDCAVFGIPDEEFGEALAAVIQIVDGAQLTADEVRSFLAARIARYKIPKVVEFRDELPRQDTGKIYKRLLRDEYWKAAGRKI